MAAKWKKTYQCGAATTVRVFSALIAEPFPKLIRDIKLQYGTLISTVAGGKGQVTGNHGRRVQSLTTRNVNPYGRSTYTIAREEAIVTGSHGRAIQNMTTGNFNPCGRFMSVVAARGRGRGKRGTTSQNQTTGQINRFIRSYCAGAGAGPGESKTDDENKETKKYFTSNALEGVELDPSGYTTLARLLEVRKDLCFENHNSAKGLLYFSPFSTAIFERILFVAVKKAGEGFWLRLKASNILVKHEDKLLLEVALDENALMDGNTKCFYEDKVLGPFSAMLHKELRQVFTKEGGLMKELCWLIGISSMKPRWSCLEDIMTLPLFWSMETRLYSFLCAKTFISSGTVKSYLHHGLPLSKAPARQFHLFTDSEFQAAFTKHDAFLHQYYVMPSTDGEYTVTVVEIVPAPNWVDVFSSVFSSWYKFGTSKKVFSRNTVSHFFDDNNNGYVALLEEPTVKGALIHMDWEFNICLSTYMALYDLQHNNTKCAGVKIDRDLLNIKYRST